MNYQIFAYLYFMWSNFHTHNHYCDGKGTVLDYLRAATKQGVGQIGFSSHAPLPFPCNWCMKKEYFGDYLSEIAEAKKAFPDLEVYTGLEIDFIPGMIGPADFSGKLDFTIGSIHFVGRTESAFWEIDNTPGVFREGLDSIFKGDLRAAVTEYFSLTRAMVQMSRPDILGHMDKIKVNAKNFSLDESEPWYVAEVEETLEAVRNTPTIIEINTRGIYKKKSDHTYPSPWILERILDYNIPVAISSDAHHPEDLTREFEATCSMIRDIGFREASVLKSGAWKNVPLDEYGPIR